MQPVPALVFAAALCAPLQAQEPVVFAIDQAASQWTWSGTSSLGDLLGNPSNQFALSGDQVARLTAGANPVDALELLAGGTAMVVPDISARVPNPFPFLPDLATIDIVGLVLEFSSPAPAAVDASGSFTIDVISTVFAGTVIVEPLVGTPTTQDLAGQASLPVPVTGTLVQTGSNVRLSAPISGTFDFDDAASGTSASIALDGILAGDWACPAPVNYCQPNPNSTGGPGVIGSAGSTRLQDANFELIASGLPTGQFAYFLASRTQGLVNNPMGSQGVLCLGGDIARFTGQVGQVVAGQFSIPVDLNAIPLNPSVDLQPGDTLNFQCWYRDANPGPTSNFTDGLTVVFCP